MNDAEPIIDPKVMGYAVGAPARMDQVERTWGGEEVGDDRFQKA
jgi:hypothetical protein